MIYETCIVWDNEFFAHQALTLEEAKEWAAQYPKDAMIRIWILS